MKNEGFKISFKTAWLFVLESYIEIGIGLFARLRHWGFSEFILVIGLMLFLSTWLISGMVKNKIYNKSFWVMSISIFTPIATILYTILRNKLISLEQKNKNTANTVKKQVFLDLCSYSLKPKNPLTLLHMKKLTI